MFLPLSCKFDKYYSTATGKLQQKDPACKRKALSVYQGDFAPAQAKNTNGHLTK